MNFKYEKKGQNKKTNGFKTLISKLKTRITHNKKNIIMISAISASLVTLAVIGILIATSTPNSGNENNSHSFTNETITSQTNDTEQAPTPTLDDKLTQYEQAQENNPDTVAWLNVGGTTINAAVMQTDNNDYYLRRDENRQENIWGCYFADYYASLHPTEAFIQNTVIYGHTDTDENPDGEKFSALFNYNDIDFLKENPYIYLTVYQSDYIFEIFAVYYADISFYYIDPNPSSQNFDAFMQEVNDKNEYIFSNTQVTEEDKLITLSGCSYQFDTNNTGNHRYVIMGKLVDAERDDISIEPNPTPVRPNPEV